MSDECVARLARARSSQVQLAAASQALHAWQPPLLLLLLLALALAVLVMLLRPLAMPAGPAGKAPPAGELDVPPPPPHPSPRGLGLWWVLIRGVVAGLQPLGRLVVE